MMPFMQCGHQAQGTTLVSREGTTLISIDFRDFEVPCCVICDCLIQSDEAMEEKLKDRVARCCYYNTTPSGRNHESNFGCKREEQCMCEQSSLKSLEGILPFFVYRKDKNYDVFYCGCWGWD